MLSAFLPPFFAGCWIFFVSSRVSRVRKKHDAEQRETITTTTITIRVQKENVAPSLFQRRIVQHRECLSSINGNYCFFFFFFFLLLLLLLPFIAVVVLNSEKKSFAIFDD